MPRKRKTDHESAIAAAEQLFWRNGYEGTSTRDIEESTGLTRFTLQTTYGGKEQFFLDTLDAYLDRAEAHHFPDPETYDLEALAVWFERLVEAERMPEIGDCGCLAFNSIGAFSKDDPEVEARIKRYLDCLESRITAILTKASGTGEMNSDLEVPEMARILVNIVLGLHVVIKARSENAFAQIYGKSGADLIRSWMRQP